MNKKAIMIKFLVTVVLALLIFTPACYFTSKLFRLSNQAATNFNDFVNVIGTVSNSGDGSQSSFLLILDDDTSIVKFNEDGEKVWLIYPSVPAFDFDARSGFGKNVPNFGGSPTKEYMRQCSGDDCKQYYVFYDYPDNKCTKEGIKKDCMMLCQQVEFIDTFVREEPLPRSQTVTGVLQIFNRELFCKQSVVIQLEDDVNVQQFYKFRSGDDPRRTVTKLKNEGGMVYVTFE